MYFSGVRSVFFSWFIIFNVHFRLLFAFLKLVIHFHKLINVRFGNFLGFGCIFRSLFIVLQLFDFLKFGLFSGNFLLSLSEFGQSVLNKLFRTVCSCGSVCIGIIVRVAQYIKERVFYSFRLICGDFCIGVCSVSRVIRVNPIIPIKNPPVVADLIISVDKTLMAVQVVIF